MAAWQRAEIMQIIMAAQVDEGTAVMHMQMEKVQATATVVLAERLDILAAELAAKELTQQQEYLHPVQVPLAS